MANKNLGEADAVHDILHSNSIFVEVDGSVRRLTVEEFLEAINEGQSELASSATCRRMLHTKAKSVAT